MKISDSSKSRFGRQGNIKWIDIFCSSWGSSFHSGDTASNKHGNLIEDFRIQSCIWKITLSQVGFSLNLQSLLAMSAALDAFMTMLLICYASTKISTDLFGISEIIYQSSWYEYSEPSKKLLLVMMMKTQNPFCFTGFGFVNSTLETFVAVSIKLLQQPKKIRSLCLRSIGFSATEKGHLVLHYFQKNNWNLKWTNIVTNLRIIWNYK